MQINEIGDFDILEELPHQGNFGKVFLGYHKKTNQKVAIKVLDCQKFLPTEIQRLKKEGDLLSQLEECPYIAQIIGFGEEDGYYFVATEFIDGITLREWIDSFSSRQPPFDQTATIIAKVAEGLSDAHNQHIVHRDIKPANIMLRKDSLDPVIVDFGVGLCAADAVKVLRHTVLGTPAYMAPETLQKMSGLRTQADIFSLGITLNEMLTGQHPCFDRIAGSQLAFEHSTVEVFRESYCHEILANLEPPRSRCSEIDEVLSNICVRCTQDNFRNRYSSAIDVSIDLNQWRQTNELNKQRKPHHPKSVKIYSLIGILLLFVMAVWSMPHWNSKNTSAKNEGQKQADYFNNLKARDTFSDPVHSKGFWEFRKPNILQKFNHRIEPTNVYIDFDRLVLVNRGYLVSRDEFSQGASISFKWMWSDGRGTYCDDLTVAIRTTGTPGKKWSHEVTDGITIRFAPEFGRIRIKELPSNRVISSTKGLDISRNQWHIIRITDDKKKIRVYFNNLESPVTQTSSDYHATEHHIAIYNREPVSAVNKKSIIDDVIIYSPSQ